MARTAPSGDIATSAPWLTAALTPSRTMVLAITIAASAAGKIAELFGDPIGEIAGSRSGTCDGRKQRPLLARCAGLAFGDDARLDHVGEDPGGARRRLVAITGRIEPRRRLE